uniref:Uncharacterized protein n=1 Tax=Aegilops tauschii subsp. strangulata TaxID=200361 RepID=A0A453KGV3_AEGTS
QRLAHASAPVLTVSSSPKVKQRNSYKKKVKQRRRSTEASRNLRQGRP